MRIHIEDLAFDAVIGILDSERERPQRVVVELEADYRYENAQNYLDYAAMAEHVKSLFVQRKFHLLEEALEETAALLRAEYPQIERLFLKVSKPDILPYCNVALSKHWNF